MLVLFSNTKIGATEDTESTEGFITLLLGVLCELCGKMSS
jgi:hypothetical protein